MKLQKMLIVGFILVASQMFAAEGYGAGYAEVKHEVVQDPGVDSSAVVPTRYKKVLEQLLARYQIKDRAEFTRRCSLLPLNADSSYLWKECDVYAEPLAHTNRRLGYMSSIADRKDFFCGLYARHMSTRTDNVQEESPEKKAAQFVKFYAAQEFVRVLSACAALHESAVASDAVWLGGTPCKYGEQRYVQRYILPAEQKVVGLGDMHGAVSSLQVQMQCMQDQGILKPDSFELADKETIVVCTGDYTDRGAFGMEVLYAIARLKLANPQQVFLVRGNHEDGQMAQSYGFIAELEAKLGLYKNTARCIGGYYLILKKDDAYADAAMQAAQELYDRLPSALFLKFLENGKGLLFCHGGLPIRLTEGYESDVDSHRYVVTAERMHMPNALLKADTHILCEVLPALEKDATQPYEWSDLVDDDCTSPNKDRCDHRNGRHAFCQATVEQYYQDAGLEGMVRAHQHVPGTKMMEEIYAHKGVRPHYITEENRQRIMALIADAPSGSYEHELSVSHTRTCGVFSDSWIGVRHEINWEGLLLLHLKGSWEKSTQKILWNYHEALNALLPAIKAHKKEREEAEKRRDWW